MTNALVAAALAAVPLHFSGNVVMPQEVYRAVLHLPEEAPADEATATQTQAQLLSFLRRAGFELAEVRAAPLEGAIDVQVNEGRLEKVVFRGLLTLKTLQFKLALHLPQDVFNRPHLEREMSRLCQELGIVRAWFELVPTQEVQHVGPQLEELPALQGLQLVYARQRYELHIFFAEHEWDVGFGLDLRSGYPDGLELGANYQGRGLLFSDDRWRVAASAGGQLRRLLADERLYGAASRAFAEGRWYSPRVWGEARPFLWLRAEGIARQRPDLRLENYNHAAADASLNLQYEPASGLALSLGGGVQYRNLFRFTAATGERLPVQLPTAERLRSFALLRADLVFHGGEARWDRRHALSAEARHFFALKDPHYGEGRAEYQKVWALGWHDLWLKARATALWGEVLFHDEEPVGRHLRSVFGDEYVRRVASVTLEYRFSVTRDLFKLSVFHDLAAFGQLDRAQDGEQLRVGNAFGPGFHALIEGMLQLDLYLSFGFASNGRFDAGAAAVLQKVF